MLHFSEDIIYNNVKTRIFVNSIVSQTVAILST